VHLVGFIVRTKYFSFQLRCGNTLYLKISSILERAAFSSIWEGKQHPSSSVKQTTRKASLRGEMWWGECLSNFLFLATELKRGKQKFETFSKRLFVWC
jgi:hypothetical protein